MPPEIHTSRLRLRPLEPADAEAVAALANDWQVVRMLARRPFPYMVVDAAGYIEQVQRERPLDWGVFTDRLIGCVGVDGQLGYWFGRAHWGQGYATEAATAALDAFFTLTTADAIASGAYVENTASQRVLAKLGFVETGRSTKHSQARKEEVPHVDMRLTRSAWAERRQTLVGSDKATLSS